MDVQTQQALAKVHRWFSNSSDWQKDLFCTIWVGASKDEQILDRAVKLSAQEFLDDPCRLTPKTTFPNELSFSDRDKPPVTLKSISNITGVGALSPNAILQFENGLNVVYGENGCGKSSYVRILKSLENYSYAENVLGNVFDENPTPAKANVTFSVDGADHTIAWTKTYKTKCPIQIYDTATARQFVDKENEVVYEPKALSLITQMASIYEKVASFYKSKSLEVQHQQTTLPQDLRSHPIASEYERIASTQTADAFAKTYQWNDDTELELASIIESLKESNPAKAATVLETKKEIVRNHGHAILELIKLVDNEACEVYLKKQADQIKTKKAHDDLIIASRKQSLLESFGGKVWRDMWNQANAYIALIESRESVIPVSESGRCALCQQEINASAKERLHSFQEFLDSHVTKNAESAYNVFSSAVRQLQSEIENAINLGKIKAALLASAIPEEVSETILKYYSQVIERCDWLLNYDESKPTDAPILEVKNTIIETFRNILAKMDAQITALKATSVNQEKQIVRKDQLIVIKWAVTNLPYKIQLLKLQKIISDCKTNSLTTLKKDLSRLLITEAYISRFQKEMHALDKDNQIKVELVEASPRRGKSYHQVSLRGAKSVGNHKNGEILSEGEFRVVSLAAFLADLSAWGRIMPFIFDDPINSLDQKYETRVATRLVELSIERQVIVFTHRLAFAQLLNTEATNYNIYAEKLGETERVTINNAQLRRSPLGCSEPPTFLKDVSLSKAIKHIRGNELPAIKRTQREGNYAIADALIQSLCSDFRKIIEQAIGQDLLSGIVSRYGREVSSLKLPRLYALSQADISLFHNMMSKYSCYEHSQPVETPVSLPDISDIEADLNTMADWAKEFDKRCEAEAKKARGN